MVKDYRPFIDKNNNNDDQDDVNMDQYFGSDSVFHKKERIGMGAYNNAEPEIPKISLTNILEKIFSLSKILPMNKKMGYIYLLIVLMLAMIVSVLQIKFGQFFGAGVMILLTLYLLKVWKDVPYDKELNYYCANSTITMKALLKQYALTDVLLPNGKKLLYYSIMILIFQQLLLQWFFPHSISNLLYATSFFLMMISALLCFANRETEAIVSTFKMYSFVLLIVLIISIFFFGTFSYFTVITYLVLYSISSVMNSWKIESLIPDKKKMDKNTHKTC